VVETRRRGVSWRAACKSETFQRNVSTKATAPHPAACAAGLPYMRCNSYDFPIRTPARKTSAPPSRTCTAAEKAGVSI
jgi:hypothetical protein